MRRFLLRVAGVFLLSSLAWLAVPFASGSAQEPATKSLREMEPSNVLVVFELEGKLMAIRLEQESQIAVFQSCFPDYRSRPAGEGMALWKPKYEIYFNFPSGETVRVAVSSNSRYWSTGRGALEIRGAYFNHVIHELLKEKMR